MCSQTSQPPRREMYEIETELGTHEVPFLLPAKPHLRLTMRSWTSGRVGLYNANFASNGDRFLTLKKPWTVVTPSDYQTFYTFGEAATYAYKGMTK